MNEKSGENELVVPFESQNLPAEHKGYWNTTLRDGGILFASIQGFSEIYNSYVLLDRIWFREFQDLEVASDPKRIFPLLLYFNAHAKIRVIGALESSSKPGVEPCTCRVPHFGVLWFFFVLLSRRISK
jgi:hypothetical protein